MENLGKDDGRERQLLSAIINFSFQQGWITENDWLQIESKGTVNGMELALFQLMKNVRNDETASKLFHAIRCINEMNLPPTSVYDEHGLQSTIMSKLLEESIITEKEMIAFERKLRNKGSRVAKTYSNDTSSYTPHEVNEGSVFQLCRNPLDLPPVIKCVLQYFSNTEIMNLRFISREWSSVGRSVLPTFANIQFDSVARISKFFQEFASTSNEVLPFHSFIFSGDRDKIWRVSELNDFFAKQGIHITKLKLREIYLVENSWEKIDCFDITPWISNCLMTKQKKTKHDTKLSVSCGKQGNLAVDFNALIKITQVKLDKMQVNLQDGIRISPTKLKLSEVTFIKDGQKLATLCVNDVVDFSKAKSICLEGHGTGEDLSLDMGGYLELEQLTLSSITLVNWETCRWKVEKLVVDFINFTENTQMEVKELVVQGFMDLDISLFPPTVEKLTFEEIYDEAILFPGPVVINNVRFLELNFIDDVVSLFTRNAQFPNLTHLHLLNKDYNIENIDLEIDIEWIPTSVKYLSLRHVKIKNRRNNILNLDKLILSAETCFKIEEFCHSNIKTKELVLDFGWQSNNMELSLKRIVDNLEHSRTCLDCVQRFYVGNVIWRARQFDVSPIRHCVDRKASWYLFQNQKGTAIDDREFDLKNDIHRTYKEMK